MSTVRVAKRDKFTVVANATVQDDRLTWEARGLLVFLLSKPDDWTVNREYLVSQSPAGQNVVRRILIELREHGYTDVRRFRGDDGHVHTEYVIYERPDQARLVESRLVESPPVGSPTSRLPDQSAHPPVVLSTEVPKTEVPKTEETNARVEPLSLEIETPPPPDRFADFWTVYPRHVAKAKAREEWGRAVRAGVDADAVIEGAKRYAAEVAGAEARYIAHPATWLHQGRWEDEPLPAGQPSARPTGWRPPRLPEHKPGITWFTHDAPPEEGTA